MKKIKLFLSLCMMCLCVAVLCIGILAASSATYNINGKISYNMIDGVALVNTRVYKVAGTETDLSTKCTELSSKSFEDIERISSPYYILSQKLDNQPLINTSNGTSASNTTSVNIVYGAVDSGVEYYTYYVVIEIKNVSTYAGDVLNAYLNDLGTSTISNLASNAIGSDNAIEIKSGEYSNIVIGLSYTGKTTAGEKFSYTLNVSYEEKVGLTLYDGGTYYYANLGYTDTTQTTPIQWRYVGYGTTGNKITTFNQITYEKGTIPKIKSGAIFVQETALGTFDYAYDGTNTKEVRGGSTEWDTDAGTCTNYFNSSLLRTCIKEGGLFSLTTDEKKYLTNGYISARTLPDISWSCYNAYSSALNSGNTDGYTEVDGESFAYPYKDSSYSAITSNSKGTDYFWLMSVDEVCLYFTDSLTNTTKEPMKTAHANLKWTTTSGTDLYYWLRTPCYARGYDKITLVSEDGCFLSIQSHEPRGIRAAFQLA